MRRRLATLSVLFLIALMVQIIAPIAASWTPAIAASDSLSFAEVCHRGAASIKPLSRQTADRTPVASMRCGWSSCVRHCGLRVEAPRVDTFLYHTLRMQE